MTETHSNSLRHRHSLGLRIWHWLTVLAISGSLLTLLLNKTVLKPRENVPLIQEKMLESSLALSKDQAKTIAHYYSDKIWDIHVYFGYALSALFLLRILLEFFQKADQKLIRSLKNAKQSLYKGYAYLGFYLVLLVMSGTGLAMVFLDEKPEFKSLRHNLKEIHSFGLYLVLLYIAAHLVGVILAEASARGKGIVSDMINGGEE